MKLASDQRTTTACSSFGASWWTSSEMSNSAGVFESFASPTGCPLTSTYRTPSNAPKCSTTGRRFQPRGTREAAAVDAGLVLLGHVRRQVGERHLDVGVLGLAEALHRPEPWHVDTAPAAPRVQRVRRFFRTRRQAKLPLAVERGEPGRARAVERGVGGEPVQARELRQHPAALRRRGRAARRAPSGASPPAARARRAVPGLRSRARPG